MASIISTCSAALMESKMSARVWLEVGYACEPRRAAPGRAASQEWRVWVRGVAGADVAAFVRKVVFRLRPENKFPYPERVFEEPPYQVQKCGVAPTEVAITVFLRHTTQSERINLSYGPLVVSSEKCQADSRCVFYDVKYPSKELKTALMMANPASNKSRTLVALPESDEMKPLQHKRVLNLKNSEARKSLKRKAAKQEMHLDSSINHKFHKNRKLSSSLKEDKCLFLHMTQMCTAQSLYEKSGNALQLPPLSDPLFHLPELPASLRHALPDDEPDYVLQ